MSYILDALKKSEQERQQGTSPHLYSMHSSAPSGRYFSQVRLRRRLWLLAGGVLLFFTSLGIFLFLNRQSIPPQSTVVDSARTTTLEQPARQDAARLEKQATTQAADKNTTNMAQVIIKEKSVVLRSVAVKDTTLPRSRVAAKDDPPPSVPQLKDLSADVRALVPELNFAGHTYSEDPAQRMIIANGQISREGDTIAPSTRLSEITWEGVVIDFNGTRFLVKTN